MKQFITFALLGLGIALHGCNKVEELPTQSQQQNYLTKLPEQETLIFQGVKFNFTNIAPITRMQCGKEYKITARNADIEIISYLFIDKINNGYLFEHYTEDKQLIASIQCDENLQIEDIYIEPLTQTRGLRFWWACAQQQYYEAKAQQAEMGMMMDVANDWLPMATINSIMAGLYCMGTK